jgi:radial spoke head protein 9
MLIKNRMRLELALLNLGGNYHFDDLFFWGRIEGIERDYYIALGLKCKGQYEFPLKKFFWASSTNTHFSELPSYNPKYIS